MLKKILLILITSLPSPSIYSQSWDEIFLEKASLLGDTAYLIITAQYKSFIKKQAPIIVDSRIKSITILENNESLVDIRQTNNPRITLLPNPPENKPYSSPACNSGLPNASKMRKEVYQRLEKMITHLDRLAASFGYEPGEVAITLFEGLRDIQTQEKLFQQKYEEIKLAHPHFTHDEAELETAKWVSPTKNNVPVHSTGAAIDIRLWNTKTNDFLDLGKFGAINGENDAAQTYSEHITDTQKRNRLYLLMAAAQAGLTNYVYEYWHFSYGDRYAAYWQEQDADKRVACYGSI